MTWNLPSSSNIHNVRFEDGSFRSGDLKNAPWTAEHTFPAQEKTYRYYCEQHGALGGAGMSGVVYVNADGKLPPPTPYFIVDPTVAGVGRSVMFYATAGLQTIRLRVTDSRQLTGETTRAVRVTSPPTASFTIAPSPAGTGQTVTFDGSASADPDGSIAKYEWDLDGEEGLEKSTGTTAAATASYSNLGLRTVKLRVTDDLGVASETTRTLPDRRARDTAPGTDYDRRADARANSDGLPGADHHIAEAGGLQHADGRQAHGLPAEHLQVAEGCQAPRLREKVRAQAQTALSPDVPPLMKQSTVLVIESS